MAAAMEMNPIEMMVRTCEERLAPVSKIVDVTTANFQLLHLLSTSKRKIKE